MRHTLFGLAGRFAAVILATVLNGGSAASGIEIVVSGITDPKPERLAEALEDDDDLLRFSAPSTSDEAFGTAVADAAQRALQRQGYVNPAVNATVGQEGGRRRVAVEIVPGERLTAGDIQVKGLAEPLAAELRAWLMRPQPPSSAKPRVIDAGNAPALEWVNDQGRPARMKQPLWTSGEPAAVDPLFPESVKRLVVRFLREEGYLLAADQISEKEQTLCQIEVIAIKKDDDDQRQAALSLAFEDLPPPATLGDVVVNGAAGAMADAVRSYLKLQDGSRVSETDRRLWEERLRQSGRFIRQRVSFETSVENDGGVTAVFDLLVHPKVTPLGMPLSREETVMLKFRSWLSNALEGDGIRVCWTRPDDRPMVSCLLSAEHGAVISLEAGADRGSVAVTEAGLGVFLSGEVGRFEVPLASLGQAVVHAALNLRDTVDPKTGDYRHDLSLAASFGSAASESEPAAVVTARIEPVACVALVHRKPSNSEAESEHRWQGKTLEIRSDGGVARFDEDSGRLLEIQGTSFGCITVAEAGPWDAQLAAIRERSGTNVYQPQAPVTSAIAFFGSDSAQALVGRALMLFTNDDNASESPSLWSDVARAIQSTARDGGYQQVDERVSELLSRSGHRDEIPVIPADHNDSPKGDAMTRVLENLSAKAWSWLDDTCGSDAWPTGFARLANAIFRQDGAASFQEVAAFMGSEQAGPVAHLMAASAIPMKPLAASFAMRGQSRVDAAAFARDCEPLMAVLEKVGMDQAIVSTLRRLDDDEARRLGATCFGNADGFASFVSQLRTRPTDRSAVEAVPEALMAWWEASLGETVSLALQERSGGRIAGRETAEPRLRR